MRCHWIVLALTLAGAAAAADGPKPFDWPQWRGPERTALCKETGLLTSWPKDGPPLAWTSKNRGGGYSTVSVAAGKVFGMGYREGGEYIWALDEATGKELWATRIANQTRVGYGEGSRSTPTVDGDLLYAVGLAGDLVCLDVAKGSLKWRKNFPKELNGRMMSGWGFSESPLVDGDKVIATPGADNAALAAFDKKTGRLLWKAAVPGGGGAAYSSVVASDGGGQRQYIQWLGQCLVGVSAKDGKLLWKYSRNANRTANIPTPIVRDDLVFCSTGYGAGSALLRLVPENGGVKAEEVYFLDARELQNHHGGLVLVGDYIYGGHGHNAGQPVCVEFLTGKVVWKERGPGSGSAAVLYADGHLYFRYQNGVMALIEASPAGYKEKGRFQLPNDSGKPSWPHPVIANGRLYVRDQDALMCFNVKQGA
jgi:outer membrane protein assembly factor BamB